MKIQDDLDLHLKEEASRIIGEEAENGIEFTIVVPATQKRLLLLLRIHYVHGGEFATR